MVKRDEYRMLAVSSILGYGFPEDSLKRGMDLQPDMLGVDGGSSDPGPYYLDDVRADIDRRASAFGVPASEYKLVFHVYGRDGVMGEMETLRNTHPHEICLVMEVIGKTQQEAMQVLSIARVITPKMDFPGRLCTSGNMAFPFSPSDIPVGPTYRFSVFHVIDGVEPCEMFPMHLEEV